MYLLVLCAPKLKKAYAKAYCNSTSKIFWLDYTQCTLGIYRLLHDHFKSISVNSVSEISFMFVNLGVELPILVGDSDLEKYPEFKKLLKTLTRYVADDGTTKEIKKDNTEVWNVKKEHFKHLA